MKKLRALWRRVQRVFHLRETVNDREIRRILSAIHRRTRRIDELWDCRGLCNLPLVEKNRRAATIVRARLRKRNAPGDEKIIHWLDLDYPEPRK